MRAGVARGELQIGTWINMARNPAVLSLLKAAGLDFARVDMEHSSPSMETIADMALVARAIQWPACSVPLNWSSAPLATSTTARVVWSGLSRESTQTAFRRRRSGR